MINLLPENKKGELRREYRIRRASVALFATSAVLLVGAGAFLPLYLTLQIRQDAIVASTAGFLAREEKSQAGVRSAVASLETQLKALEGIATETSLATGIIPLILSKKGDIAVQGIAFQRASGNRTIRLNGISPRRETLISFLRALEESGLFTEVRSPVSNLVKDKNLIFSIELVLKK